MPHPARELRERYGRWALIVGASDGLGAAFARYAGARGLDLVLVARRADLLERQASDLRASTGAEVRCLTLDLSDPAQQRELIARSEELEVGLLVYVASKSNIGPFVEQPLEEHLAGLELNCRGPMVLAHHFARRMRQAGRGGIVLLSSFSALVGCPLVAHYAATKAYNLVLAESMWAELRGTVDVLGAVVGVTLTPQMAARRPDYSGLLAPPVMTSEEVVEETFRHLGRRGSVVIGRKNRLNALLVTLLPRSVATMLVGHTTRQIFHVD